MERKKNRGHLSLDERQIIHQMQARGVGCAEIGRAIYRHRSVVKRELERNAGQRHIWRYLSALERAKEAHERAKRRRCDSKKGRRGPLKLSAIRERIVSLLQEAHYSPEAIAHIISQSDLGVSLCGKTVRRWLLREAPELRQHLPHRGRARRHHLTPKKSRSPQHAAPQKRSIHERPAPVKERQRLGDLEGDMIVCKKSTSAILSLIDRKTRRRWYRKVSNLKAETVLQALICLLGELTPLQRHTITFDNGGEFSQWKVLERLFGVTVYFCDPYCAWQKGSVEHSNKEFRRFVPKGTDIALVSNEDIARIEDMLNCKPMDCLNMLSSSNAWRTEKLAVLH